jgi:hypothetical protein
VTRDLPDRPLMQRGSKRQLLRLESTKGRQKVVLVIRPTLNRTRRGQEDAPSHAHDTHEVVLVENSILVCARVQIRRQRPSRE